MRLRIVESGIDEVTIEGTRYAGDMFRNFGCSFPRMIGQVLRVVRKDDGVLTVKRLHDLEAGADNGEALELLEAMPGDKRALLDVLAERVRQTTVEGFTTDDDDRRTDGELVRAAACYALHAQGLAISSGGSTLWPWAASWWKPKTRRHNLVRAAALLIAEIQRVDRELDGDPAGLYTCIPSRNELNQKGGDND